MTPKTSYLPPQSTLKQILEDTPDAPQQLAYTVVIGPHYVHTTDDSLVWGTYVAGATLDYRRLVNGVATLNSGDEIDTDNVKLFAKNARATLNLWDDDEFASYTLEPNGLLLTYAAGIYDTSDPLVAQAFDNGRIPQPGDIFEITQGSRTVVRSVVGLEGEDIDPSFTNSVSIGATAWTTVANAAVGLVSSTVTLTGAPVLTAFTELSAEEVISAFVRANGVFGTHEGLRLAVELNCTVGGADTDAATFTATANGIALTVAASVDGTDSEFILSVGATALATVTLPDFTGAWVLGDKVVINLDYEAPTTAVASVYNSPDFSDYTLLTNGLRIQARLRAEVIAVSSSALELRITSTPGLATSTTVTLEDDGGVDPVTVALPYDSGTIEFTVLATVFATAYLGQAFEVLVNPPSRSTTVFDKVRFNAPLGLVAGDSVVVKASAPFTGEVIKEAGNTTNFTASADEVVLGTVVVPVAGYSTTTYKPLETGVGQSAVGWRALQAPAFNEGMISILNEDEITSKLGSYHMDSELGFGALMALRGGREYAAENFATYANDIKVLRTSGKTVADFEDALRRIESERSAYALAILTEDEAVMQKVANHVFAMSDEYNKKFRRAYVGTDSPGEYYILNVRADSSPYAADVVAGNNGNNLVEFVSTDVDFNVITVTAGDFLEVAGLPEGSNRFEIKNVISENELELVSGPALPLAAAAVKIVAADTAENTARYVWERTYRLGAFNEEDRRICNIWTDNGILSTASGNILIPNRFLACEMAGARTKLPPHQGLSRMPVVGISAAPRMYTKFRPEILNDLGARGVWVITQDAPEKAPYVRHQLTTATTGGLLFYEDSAGTNIDLMLFEVDDVIDPKIGKVNANRKALVVLKADIIDKLNEFTQEDETPEGRRLGARLEKFYNLEGEEGSVFLELNKNFKDQFDHAFVMEVPVPLNRVRTLVLARTIQVATGAVTSGLTTSVIA